MLAEFESYVNYVVGDGSVKFANNYTPSKENEDYYKTDTFKKSGNGEDNDDIDYSKFIYAEGKVDFGEFDNRNIMLPDSPQYKAMSAVKRVAVCLYYRYKRIVQLYRLFSFSLRYKLYQRI